MLVCPSTSFAHGSEEKGYDLLRRGDEIEGSDPAGSRKCYIEGVRILMVLMKDMCFMRKRVTC